MIKNILSSFFLYAICLLLIALYSLIIYAAGNVFFEKQAGGSLIVDKQGEILGSILLAQVLDSNKYFTTRSAMRINKDCDVALYNADLQELLTKRFNDSGVPFDVSSIMPSFSLLDPYITKRQAENEMAGIAKARHIDEQIIKTMIDDCALYKFWPFFELEIVNTTLLNAMLDKLTTSR